MTDGKHVTTFMSDKSYVFIDIVNASVLFSFANSCVIAMNTAKIFMVFRILHYLGMHSLVPDH